MVHGGQQPVSGSTIQLYAVGTTAGSASIPLISSTITTDSGGSFGIGGAYKCPASNPMVYLTATGGNPGLAAGTNNRALVMAAALGPCNNLGPSTYISINEVTTVAAMYAMAPLGSSYTALGSSSSSAIAADFTMAAELANSATGAASGPAVPSGASVPVSNIHTLADILSTCINSAGGTAGDGSACGNLLQIPPPPGTTALANTADAMLSIATYPAKHVNELYNLTPPAGPFQPTLKAAPSDWTLPLSSTMTLSVPSPLIAGNSTADGTITLGMPAPAAGTTVALTSSNPRAVSVVASVTIAAGQTTGTFNYNGLGLGAVTLTATAANFGSASVNVTDSQTSLYLTAPQPFHLGDADPLGVQLNTPAPAGGLTVSLSCDPGIATISPASVNIAAGKTLPDSQPQIRAIGLGTTRITAIATGYGLSTGNATSTATATLPAATAITETVATSALLTLSAAAPAGGLTFTVKPDNSALVTVPASITIPAGQTSVAIPLTGLAPGTTTLRATANNVTEADLALTVVLTSAQAIKHIVVIFDENVSFDHYFATYPTAANSPGEPAFTAAAGTPAVAGLTGSLLTANPNSTNSANGAGAANPFRLDRLQATTADQEHDYGAEQMAFHAGQMDQFPLSVGVADSPALANITGAAAVAATSGLTMGYYDGNTVTALWNYAQRYSLNDHSFGTTFGPSTVGAINLISGQTNGVVNDNGASGRITSDGSNGFTLIADAYPTGDLCSTSGSIVHMTGRNIGDLLNAGGVTWGFFQGGFDLTASNPNGSTGCTRSRTGISGAPVADYVPHHQPFQFYASTANPNHLRPSSAAAVGTAADPANHQYDLHDFTDAMAAGNLPAVSFLKPPAAQDGHAGYSDPLDEQTFLVNAINAVEQSAFWQNTVIVIAYDDSDGWYDHMIHVVNGSISGPDALTQTSLCSAGAATPYNALPGVDSAATPHAQGRCGYGPRLPLLVLSPWAKRNFVDTTLTDQTSIVRLIEDTFLSGQRIGGGSYDAIAAPLTNMLDFSSNTPPNPSVVVLDPATGLITSVK